MGTWQERLKTTVPRSEIPTYLNELQALVAYLRRERDDLRVPPVDAVRERLTPLLRRYPELTVAYLDDARYAEVTEKALGEGGA